MIVPIALNNDAIRTGYTKHFPPEQIFPECNVMLSLYNFIKRADRIHASEVYPRVRPDQVVGKCEDPNWSDIIEGINTNVAPITMYIIIVVPTRISCLLAPNKQIVNHTV